MRVRLLASSLGHGAVAVASARMRGERDVADGGGVAHPHEQVGVDVEGDRRACVAEDAADLADVEAQVDDQVAGEGVAQVVEAKRRPAAPVEAGASRGAREGGAGDVPLPERRAAWRRRSRCRPGSGRGVARWRGRSRVEGRGGSRGRRRASWAPPRRAGAPRCARERWARTRTRRAWESMSAQVRASSSERRMPV
jgi:hypothetical protein